MDQNRTELEKKIVAAGSPEEIERILNDAGEKITAEEAQGFFQNRLDRRGRFPQVFADQVCRHLLPFSSGSDEEFRFSEEAELYHLLQLRRKVLDRPVD